MGWSIFWIGDFELPPGVRPVPARAAEAEQVESITYDGTHLRVRRLEDRSEEPETEITYRALLAAVKAAGGTGELACIAWEDGPATFGHRHSLDGKKHSLTRPAIRALFDANVDAMRSIVASSVPAPTPAPAPAGAPFLKRPAHFEVAYHPSLEPQLLDIELGYANAPGNGMPEAQMRQVVQHIALGVTGGADFAPSQSTGKLLSGPLDASQPGGNAARYHWQLEVRGVCSHYVRHIVSRMRLAGSQQVARSLVIRGSLLPPRVDTAQLDAWMADATAWAGAFPQPGFSLSDVVTPKGVTIRLVPAGPIEESHRHALSSLLREWTDATAFMPSTSFGYYKPFQLGKGKKELTAKAATFDLAPKPARDQLVNFLIRLHETECPLREVELGFPAG